jgi:hypothetical protein
MLCLVTNKRFFSKDNNNKVLNLHSNINNPQVSRENNKIISSFVLLYAVFLATKQRIMTPTDERARERERENYQENVRMRIDQRQTQI